MVTGLFLSMHCLVLRYEELAYEVEGKPKEFWNRYKGVDGDYFFKRETRWGFFFPILKIVLINC